MKCVHVTPVQPDHSPVFTWETAAAPDVAGQQHSECEKAARERCERDGGGEKKEGSRQDEVKHRAVYYSRSAVTEAHFRKPPDLPSEF